MSAIWGAVSLGGERVQDDFGKIFHESYLKCQIDRTEQICFQNGIMGCELQYFTAEAKGEKLPVEDNEEICFTADVYLDNREELLNDCLFQQDNHEIIPDGEILYRFYREYGSSRIGEVIGSYAFAYYDRRNGYVDLVMDHTGNRCLYYAIVDGMLYFSTLLQPIYNLCKGKVQLDEKVLTEFIAMQDYRVYKDYEATVIQEIKHAVAGEIIRVTENRLEHIPYWNPLVLENTLKGRSDEEYKRLLIDCFKKCVREAMRTDGEVGIQLSGGLDSTSVACFAAPILREKEKKLYSYTMIPKEGYVNDTGERVNTDESPFVHETAVFLKNVEERYDSFEEMNAWDSMKEQIDFLEGPFKSLQNVIWLKHLAELARKDNCKIMLNGGLGNDTISYGNPSYYIYELFSGMHWIKLYQELAACTEYHKYNKKRTLKKAMKSFLRMDTEKILSYREFVDDCYVREDKLEKYSVYSGYKSGQKQMNSIRTRKQYLNIVLDKMRFRQIGDNETRISLHTGLIHKDPTKNPRLIELCFQLPTGQFDKDCNTRRLVYEYFREYLPEWIMNRNLLRGRQSADLWMRLEDKWEEIFSELQRDFLKDNNIIDTDKVNAFLHEHETEIKEGKINNQRVMERLLFADEIIKIQQKYY